MRELVIIISDFYLAAGGERDRSSLTGAGESLPSVSYMARFGGKSAVGEGWRSWLARWLGREDLTRVALAAIASGAFEPLPPRAAPTAVAAPAPTPNAAPALTPDAAPPPTASAAQAPTACATPSPAAGATPASAADAAPTPAGGAAPASTAVVASTPAGGAAPAPTAGTTPTPVADAAPVSAAGAASTPTRDVAPASTTDPAPATSPGLLGSAWFATPVYLIAGLTSLHLDRRSILRLPADESAGLAEDFASVFGDGEFSLEPMDSGIFMMRSRGSIDTRTTEPARAVVSDLQTSLPTGPQAPVLRRLGAELEMWLHGHPVNQRRASRGEMPVSTLWLWGGGATMAAAAQGARDTPGDRITTDVGFGTDPYFMGLWRIQGLEPLPLPDRLPNLGSYSHSQRMAVILETTPLLHSNPSWTALDALADLDRRFIAPAIAALRAGEVATLVLIANDVELQINRRDRLRFWRRGTPSGIHALQVE